MMFFILDNKGLRLVEFLERGTTIMHQTTLQQFRLETLQHLPYNSGLSPCDFLVLRPLKQAIRGHQFTTDDEL
ncbi:hypothetical protein TNCT_623801 [Trichonephila clavata]|uniref:Uncharacterized protein n=1 Tax=Trichonephila clavata TaxID=2740835 RepID=A0A8X6H9I9_TRICU|nr:hypothetical protein TNCT_623801 [Trichonephila clavata]